MNTADRKTIQKAVEIVQEALRDNHGEDAAFEIKPNGFSVVDGDGTTWVKNSPDLSKALDALESDVEALQG